MAHGVDMDITTKITDGHFTEKEARALLRKYGKGRSVHVMAGTPLFIVKDEKVFLRDRTVTVEVSKAAASLFLTKAFDIADADSYKVNVTVFPKALFIGGH